METIVIDNKRFVIKKGSDYCGKCLFYNNSNHSTNNYPTNNYFNPSYYCLRTKCIDFVVIREVNVIDKIIIWLEKKLQKL